MKTQFIMAALSAVALCGSAGASRADNAAPDPKWAQTGKSLYAQHCSHCHGFNMVNPGTVTYDLRTFPPGQKERFVNSVVMGKGGVMPPWGDLLSLDDIDDLWAYVLTGGHI